MTDHDALRTLLPELLPAVKTLGIDYDALDADTAVCSLRDDPALHNHVGGLHAGIMFTLAETASGAIVLAAFEDLVQSGFTPLAAQAEITFTRLARGRVTATATLGRQAAEVRRELEDTGRTVRLPVHVALSTAEGETGSMTIEWALRPPR